MWHAVGNFNDWNHIITSPLQRCQAFAFALGERHGIDVAIESRFKEVGFGVWEGLSHDDVKIGRMAEYQAFLRDPVNRRPDGAEPLEDFMQRAGCAYEEVIERHRGSLTVASAPGEGARFTMTLPIDASPQGRNRG